MFLPAGILPRSRWLVLLLNASSLLKGKGDYGLDFRRFLGPSVFGRSVGLSPEQRLTIELERTSQYAVFKCLNYFSA